MSFRLRFFLYCIKLLKKGYTFFTGKQIWIFTSWEAKVYSDNPKYLYEYASVVKRKSVKAIWVTENKSLYNEMKKRGMPVFLTDTLRKKYFISTMADCFFFSDLEEPFTKRLNPKMLYVNLWHGMPIKHIGFVGADVKQDYIIATNPDSQQVLSNAMGLPKDKVLLTGQPKNDGLFTKKNLKEYLGLDKNSYIILYMPTYRGGFNSSAFNRNNATGIFLENNDALIAFNKLLEKENAYFVIKPHLRNKFDVDLGSRFLILDDFKDLVAEFENYEIMGNADMLVSDYSSIILDYFVTNRPILFYTPDFDAYSSTQKLSYNYTTISSGEQCFDQDALFNRINFYLQNRTFLPKGYQAIKEMFNLHVDAKNCERVFDTFFSVVKKSIAQNR
ncbi:CDP-glycerol glycerophosphotransferase family protein [Ferruginibacter sp. SUN002]|uniref:CDP-glycerol glycerophosphotransferase family protein n=1 Tax=Ferruginibacter sp. SUN002 TaxID=2937789 RepID=UPI003D35AD17